MEYPSNDICRVLRELTQADTQAVERAVDKYFTSDAQLVVFLYDTQFTIHCAGFDRAKVEKGVEHVTGLVDCVQHVKGRLVPLPTALNPTAHIRILMRFDCIKCPDEMYRIYFQEVNLPSDWASTGLHVFPFDAQIASSLKWMGGMAALVVGGTLMKVFG
ncbi:hypothetical protein JCM10908_002895 [Rhodotorula pacifica]|uniref:uncharacterized protein n=1 Tax=Rhodotorula pacifica TaxID=1495444 RepID=UPI00317B3F75